MSNFEIHYRDFRDFTLFPASNLLLCDPPYNLGKEYAGEKETVQYSEWVNEMELRQNSPWRLYFAPPLTKWDLNDLDESPHRIMYWCKTFVQLRKLNDWQYAVTPILVYKDDNAPFYAEHKEGYKHFDWITAPSAMTDVRETKRFFTGKHPGVTGTQICRKIIRAVTQPGDTVLDPMCGIGSVLAAALKEDRNGIGVEIIPEYANASGRWCNSLV